MKIDEILSEWEKDSFIDQTNLARESLNIPKLHYKYYKIYMQERLRLHKMQGDYEKQSQLLFDWMDGKLSQQELADAGLQPYLIKRIKSDIEKRVPHEPSMISLSDKLVVQREKIDLLETIVKSFAGRQFQIKNALDFMKFQQNSG